MKGVRKEWKGLKIKMDKSKEIGIIKSFIPGVTYFTIEVENGEIRENIYRPEFTVLRTQN